MSTSRRKVLREIMGSAWSWFRQVGGTFADALRTAWRYHRVRTARAVTLHRVKPSARVALSPLANTAALAARHHSNRAAWYGAKFANG